MKNVHVTILGSGSPEGHPIVFHPDEFIEPAELRLRPGLLIEGTDTVLFDTGPDIRQQLVFLKVKKLSAIFITHPHFDHLWGIGDLAQLVWLGKVNFKVYVSESTLAYIQKYFPWVNLPFKIISFKPDKSNSA